MQSSSHPAQVPRSAERQADRRLRRLLRSPPPHPRRSPSSRCNLPSGSASSESCPTSMSPTTRASFRCRRKLKFQLALRTSTDFASFLGAGFLAGIDQASDVAPHYEQGAIGYAKRFGAAYTGAVTDIFLGGAVFPTLFHQDPLLLLSRHGKQEVTHAARYVVTLHCEGDNGHWQMNISSLVGDVSSSAMTNLYYPKIDRGAGARSLRSSRDHGCAHRQRRAAGVCVPQADHEHPPPLAQLESPHRPLGPDFAPLVRACSPCSAAVRSRQSRCR